MFLHKLHLINFKNYGEATLVFSPAVNCFTGVNGSGKTNLLDAIHYLSLTKSYFNSSDGSSIRHGEQMAFIQGDFDREGIRESVYCGIRAGQKKQFKRNQHEYERLSDHIGAFPVVMIAPTDQELITEGSDIRRRFIDSIISQYDHEYLDNLIRYNQLLQQRNTLLKQHAVNGFVDWSLFAVWDEQLSGYGTRLFEKRQEFISGFQPLFNELFHYISGSSEEVHVKYISGLFDKTFSQLLHENRSKDLDMLYTTSGIHKDDLVFYINGFPAKKFASQGQQKSLVIALKLAHYSYLNALGFPKPIVLLDDIFDKLDEGRVHRLMEWVSRDGFGQLFITDSHRDRVARIFNEIHVPFRLFNVEKETVNETTLAGAV